MGVVRAVSRNGEYSFSKPNRDEIVLVAGLGVEGDVHAGVTVRHRSRVRADPLQPNLRQVHLIQSELFDEVGESGYVVAPGELGENVTTAGIDLLGLPRGTVLRFGAPGRGRVVPGDGSPLPDSGTEAPGGGSPASAAVVVMAADAAALDRATADAVASLVASIDRETAVDDPRPAVVVIGLRNPCRQIDGFRNGLLDEVSYRDHRGGFVRKAGVMGVVLRGGPVRPGEPITVELPPPPREPLDRV